MKHTSRFTFSILFVMLSFLAHSQEIKKKDSIVIPAKTERYGLRAGVDLFKLTRSFYDEKYKGLELVGDFRLTKKYYLAAEIGNENKTTEDSQLDFTTKGTYIKAGFDFNAYENWLDMENMIYVGMRYGVSSFSQTLNSYEIYNSSPYFPSETVSPNQKYGGLSAQWIEVVAGMKAEVLHNLFVAFSVRFNRLVSNKKPANFDNLYIPGFNKTYDGNFGVGFNYTVSYFLPIYKKKIAPKKK